MELPRGPVLERLGEAIWGRDLLGGLALGGELLRRWGRRPWGLFECIGMQSVNAGIWGKRARGADVSDAMVMPIAEVGRGVRRDVYVYA